MTTNQQPPAFSTIQYTRTRTVSVAPDVMRERRLVMGLKGDPHIGVFRLLRSNILMQLREKNWTSIAVVAATPECGKTFVTANLGIALAMEVNQTVLIVDADLGNPQIGWYFGLDVQKGLLDYLQTDVPVEELLVNPGFDRLVVLPGRHTTSKSSELISLPKMTALVDELKTRYQSRIVLFDLPPLLSSDDALLFMPHFDAALLVVEDGKTSPDEVRRSLALLEQTNLVGTVLNKARGAALPHYQRAVSS
ncbi:CpsD/CapB family tyrosine-protein kinase [Methylomonas methanica]|uniref:Putative exopolysaccharide biosynthesis related tyrosine-protein kinase n=1 Tax=Methylomonas methanica (strain DSM 25384 / MC09) TaxID=857087 RepID=G0A254_METMM|nr:CpsD/CapB family tyrosine-protein kinase [Methylomonas methanica]AEG02597.1 putative exopolysaccharide biosynthesis related tyrosine-protein kinase [Methylomonas methanica MC09]